jgi:uncharacterized membrane protein (UPF0127 family)
MNKNFNLIYKKRRISIEVKKKSIFGKFIGLMFSRRKNAQALLFEFNNNSNISLHSLFVFFPFLALFIDDKNKIVEIINCKPFQFSIKSKKKFSKIIEIPFNEKYNKILKFFSV